ncbi:MAG: hypothetical protein EOO74_12410 [Myxococcales bacterium]|nr:MAG: hypothetical protein EOO74_12410 [Myxococcales bacterium]
MTDLCAAASASTCWVGNPHERDCPWLRWQIWGGMWWDHPARMNVMGRIADQSWTVACERGPRSRLVDWQIDPAKWPDIPSFARRFRQRYPYLFDPKFRVLDAPPPPRPWPPLWCSRCPLPLSQLAAA